MLTYFLPSIDCWLKVRRPSSAACCWIKQADPTCPSFRTNNDLKKRKRASVDSWSLAGAG